MKVYKVGLLGCGNISPAYFKGLGIFKNVEVMACADLVPELAQKRAQEFGVRALSIDALLSDPSIDIVVNLTVPAAHAQVSMQVLKAGKHVYSEKPLAIDPTEGKQVLALATEKGLRVGCAPDTFLGAGLQTCRKIIDDGWIGKPLSGTAFMMGMGPEGWHPNPSFFYQKGAGPMFDMGPYYHTALVHLLGPVKALTAVVSKGYQTRVATGETTFGMEIPVQTPTHYAGVLEFHSGAVITTTISFDVVKHTHSPIEIYGTGGSLAVPDPNTFGGDVKLFRQGYKEWTPAGYSHIYSENSRGIGVAEMAMAIEKGLPHRASGELAGHVLEVMAAYEVSSEKRSRVEIASTCAQPEPLPMGLLYGRTAL